MKVKVLLLLCTLIIQLLPAHVEARKDPIRPNEDENCCSASGDPHFTMFDGVRHHFQGMCEYVLAADCVKNSWSVIIDTEESYPGAPVSSVVKVTFIFGSITIVMDLSPVVTVNDAPVAIPYNGGSFTIEDYGLFDAVYTDFGVTVIWGFYSVKVCLDPRWKEMTCGLCGTWNMNREDDIEFSSDHQHMHDETLYGPDCSETRQITEPECDPEELKYWTEVCKKLMESIECPVDKTIYIEDCAYDLCLCKGNCLPTQPRVYCQECYEATKRKKYARESCARFDIDLEKCTLEELNELKQQCKKAKKKCKKCKKPKKECKKICENAEKICKKYEECKSQYES